MEGGKEGIGSLWGKGMGRGRDDGDDVEGVGGRGLEGTNGLLLLLLLCGSNGEAKRKESFCCC